MKLSPLQVVRYSMPEITCAANPDYESANASKVKDACFKAESRVHPLESKSPEKYSQWSVELDLSQKPDKEANVPYHFELRLVGLFRCSIQPGNIAPEVFVRTNGSSILYGVARETLRSLTSLGPWGDMLLPTVSFYADAAVSEDKQAAGKRPRKGRSRN